jgi:hypothetical protein
MKGVLILLGLLAVVFVVVMAVGIPEDGVSGELDPEKPPRLAEILAAILPDRTDPVDLRRLSRVRGCELQRPAGDSAVLRAGGGSMDAGTGCRVEIRPAEEDNARLQLHVPPGSATARVAYWIEARDAVGCAGDTELFKRLPDPDRDGPMTIPVLAAGGHLLICPDAEALRVTLR